MAKILFSEKLNSVVPKAIHFLPNFWMVKTAQTADFVQSLPKMVLFHPYLPIL